MRNEISAPRSSRTAARLTYVALTALLLGACGAPAHGTTTGSQAGAGIDRLRFNQLAMRLDLPLFWAIDADSDGAPDPDEVRALLFYPSEGHWVENGQFTAAFDAALARIRAEHDAPAPTDERARLVVAELDHAAPTLVSTDLDGLPEAHRAFATRMLHVAELIDGLYATQSGMASMREQVPAGDLASASLFRRNWGPACRGSLTEREAACSAIPGAPHQAVDVYPSSMQSDETFCQTLEARPDATALLNPFTVVREENGALTAVPYTTAYAGPMGEISAALRDAAAQMTDPEETALIAYLTAAATSFETNDWGPADEAWSRMSVRNSRWYVRVAPDETYWEPCSQKAGFHLTFALINRDSLVWQDRLTPIQADMERAIAALVPGEYTARDVSFHMPDFIDIVVNAGDDRDAFGATIGQSLPNWGLVSSEGRGRTVAMSNLYTDPDSDARRHAQASAVLSPASMAHYTDDPTPGLLSTILHEATHNLGPAHEYRFEGRTADEAFGGGLASMLEELKAQSGALFYIDWLRERGVLDQQQANQTYIDSIVWAFGHISRGMYTPTGGRKAYSQLAAIQVGFLMDEGVITWDPQAMAADGQHVGAFTIDLARMPEASGRLMTRVMHIKAANDRAAAEELATRYVDGDRIPQAMIAERYLAFPQAAFVFALEN